MLPALALVLVHQAAPTAGSLISSCLALYDSAQSVRGTIAMRQQASDKVVEITSELQIDRPGMVFLRQTRTGSSPNNWLLSTDGKTFAYDRPSDNPWLPPRLEENVLVRNQALTVRDMYAAACKGLGDRSSVLDIVFGHREDLRALLRKWSQFKVVGKETVRGQSVNVISGKYRPLLSQPAVGDFSLYLTDRGEILRYFERQFFTVSELKIAPVEVRTTWEVDLALNGPVDRSLFVVVR